MASAHDVAKYILAERGRMSTWKLQKLVYYCQAWHLVWDEQPLFAEPIEAWANGPVVRTLYRKHRGDFSVREWRQGKSGALTDAEKATVDAVLASYGGLTGRQLSLLTHDEDPWRQTREGLEPTARSERHIKTTTMHAFYSALDADPAARPIRDLEWE